MTGQHEVLAKALTSIGDGGTGQARPSPVSKQASGIQLLLLLPRK